MRTPGPATSLTVIVTLALTGLLACGGDGTSPLYGGGGRAGGGQPGAVRIGAGIAFTSGHNGTSNPAIDTIAAGATVTWTWTGSDPHSVRSVGAPSFASSEVMTGSGTYAVTFNTAGTYRYHCSVHGDAMTGTIVVTAAAASYDAMVSITDPAGDTTGVGRRAWDLTSLTLARDATGVTAMLDFSRDVVSPATGDPSAVIAYLDLDLDQDAATGGSAIADEYRQDGRSTGLGVDARVNLADLAADGSVAVTDAFGRETGRVKPEYSGHRITVRVPTSMLAGDDGYVSAAAVAGVVGRPSDIVPDVGSLKLTRPAALATLLVRTPWRHASTPTRTRPGTREL
jgi:hypothetical protein